MASVGRELALVGVGWRWLADPFMVSQGTPVWAGLSPLVRACAAEPSLNPTGGTQRRVAANQRPCCRQPKSILPLICRGDGSGRSSGGRGSSCWSGVHQGGSLAVAGWKQWRRLAEQMVGEWGWLAVNWRWLERGAPRELVGGIPVFGSRFPKQPAIRDQSSPWAVRGREVVIF